MSVCGKIDAGIAFDCNNPPSGGANDRLILMNFDDWQAGTLTVDGSNPLLFTDYLPGSGLLAYSFEGQNDSVEPRAALVKGRYVDSFDHEVRFKAFNNSPTIKNQLRRLGLSKVVAIVQNNHKGTGGNAAFEVYGHETGLELQELERILNDADTMGAYNLLLRNSETSRPGTIPHTLFKTDFATTLALVNGLLV